MKNLKFLSLLVFSTLLFASCEKKESEENKPEESNPVVTTEPRIDLIRKVIRYDASGGIEDSVLFKYDAQNRVSKIEYGPNLNGNYKYKVEYQGLDEKNFVLNNLGQYELKFTIHYNDQNKATYIQRNSFDMKYDLKYDSSGFLKSAIQRELKQVSFYSDSHFTTLNNKRINANGANGSFTYEYYNEPYSYSLYTCIYEDGERYFWNSGLENPFDIRHSFLGERTKNLLKKERKDNFTSPASHTDTFYEYEFNSLGLVSKVKTSTSSSSGANTPQRIRYEIFYY